MPSHVAPSRRSSFAFAPGHALQAKGPVLCALLLAALSAGTAHAQDYLGSSLQADEFGRQLERSQEGDAAHTGAAHARRATATQADILRQLSYVPSTEIARSVSAALADALVGRGNAHPSSTLQILEASFSHNPRFRDLLAGQVGGEYDRILGALDSGVLQSRFRLQQERHGYAANNMADANIAFRIRASNVANDGRIDETRAYAALQARLRQALADGRLVPPDLEDAVKQDNVETLGLMSMLIGAAWHNAGNAQERAILQAGVNDIARRMGFDPETVVSKSEGFVQR